MKLNKRLLISTLIVGLITMLIISFSNYLIEREKSIKDMISHIRSTTIYYANHFQKEVEAMQDLANSISLTENIRIELLKSNQAMLNSSRASQLSMLTEIEKEWENSDMESEFIQNHLNSEISKFLKKYKLFFQAQIGEIFVTNKYGLAIGMTNKLTTITHAHKYWWKSAYDNSKGAQRLDDRGYDMSVEDYVFGIVVPIRNEDEVIGILKINFLINSSIMHIINKSEIRGLENIFVRSNGMIIKEKGEVSLSTHLNKEETAFLMDTDETQSALDLDSNYFYAASSIPFKNLKLTYGSSHSIDQDYGNTGDSLFIFTRLNYDIFREEFNRDIVLIIIISCALIFILLIAELIQVRVTLRPLKSIITTLTMLGQGSLYSRITNTKNDEFGEIAKSINAMAHSLEVTMTSKEDLKKEVELRKKNEKQYYDLFNSMKEGFATHEMIYNDTGEPVDYKFLSINPAFEQILGKTSQMVLGKTVMEILPGIEMYMIKEYGEIAKSGISKAFINSSRANNKTFQVTAFSLKEGKFAVLFNDVTELNEAHQKLKHQKDTLYLTLSSIGDGVISTNSEGDITFLNPVAENLTEWEHLQALGHNINEVFPIFHETIYARLESPVMRAHELDDVTEYEENIRLIPQNGVEYIIENSCSPIINSSGETTGFIIVFRDVTEKKQIELKINQAQKLDSLGVLAGGIAHDFNNYIAGLFGYTELLHDELKDTGEQTLLQYIDNMMSVFENVKSLTSQLLTFSKEGEPLKKNTNIDELLRKCSDFSFSGSNLAARLNITPDLWFCNCDEHQITQCIANLLINSVQAMPEGGQVEISADNIEVDNKKSICIQIKDNGPGINPKHIDKIFDPFYTTRNSGHGLGLSTVYSIIKQHDGSIQVESELGEFTQFTIMLPAISEKFEVIPKINQSQHQKKGTVLVLDDQDYMLDMTKEFLNRIGYSAVLVNNSTEAIAAILKDKDSKNEIRVCLLDLTIPGDTDGITTAKNIRALNDTVKIFAVSGYSDSLAISFPEENGFDDSLKKPFSLKDLSKLFDKYLD